MRHDRQWRPQSHLSSVPAAAAQLSSLTPKHSVVYSAIDEQRDDTLNTLSLTRFVQQSLRVSDARAQHPRYFVIPGLVRMARRLSERAIEFIRHQQQSRRRRRHRHGHARQMPDLLHFNEDGMNIIGSRIFSFCEQRSFVCASRVSRAWFYCSRMPTSRTHVACRLWNVLQCLIAPQDLWHTITRNSELDLVCVDSFLQQQDDDDDDDCADDYEQRHESESDILLPFLARGDASHELPSSSSPPPFQAENSQHRNTFSFLDFFVSRTQFSRLFSCLTTLQIDLTILGTNTLIYVMPHSLNDAYWDVMSTLCRIECLQSIDLVVCDPHILLLSYMLNNVHKLSLDKTELKFPSIGVPKNKFVCLSNTIRSLSFTCKSLSTAKLVQILDTHFEHFYHRQSLDKHMSETALRTHVRQQCTSIHFKTLESYQLCRKTIQKPLLFDITHALSCLNRRPSQQAVNTVRTLIMRDVRCAAKELQLFLANNSHPLQRLEISFSEFCIFPVASHRPARFAAMHSYSQSRLGTHTLGDASVNSYGSGGSSSKHSSNGNEEETGFPDVSRIARGHKLARNKSSTQLRIIANLNEIFSAVQHYIEKTTARLYEHNRRVRKQFQALKQRKRSTVHDGSQSSLKGIHVSSASSLQNIDQEFTNALRSLPLRSLAVSFPTNFDDEYVTGFFEVLKLFENPCDELKLCRLSLNGSCINPQNLRKLNWIRIFQSQHIETLCLRRMIYTQSFFENVCKLCSHSLVRLELSLSFSVDEHKSTPKSSSSSLRAAYYLNQRPIQRLFSLLSKCRRLSHVSLEFRQKPCLNTSYLQQYSQQKAFNSCSGLNQSPSLGEKCSSSDTWSAQQQRRVFGTPLPQLPDHGYESKTPYSADSSGSLQSQSQSQQSICNSTPTFGANYKEKEKEKEDHLLEPVLDIWWIHQFLTHQNVRKTIQTLSVCFNELSTKRFEARNDSIAKYTRWKQPHGAGEILRISPQFKQKVEQLIMSWFGECSTLTRFRMVRKLSTLNRFDIINDIQNSEHLPDDTKFVPYNKSDDASFDFDSISLFKDENKVDMHDIVSYEVKKWRTEHDVYKGDVIGELDQLLMPEIPIA
mmetsp:Transcript_35562/g.58268  ORF Transcript_35562/g.58268 Transcript_35562/m.58268 type:complete len:1093 (-) Transcript_35562:46-3324(-)